MKNVKTLGIATAMALALIAFVGAGTASANVFESEASPTTWSGSRAGANHKLNLGGETFSCANVNFSGTLEPNAITTTPELNNCTWNGFVAGWVMNGCKFRFHAGLGPELKGSVDITGCEKPMTFTVGTCQISIGNQSGLGPVTYKNVAGSPKTVTAIASLTGITYTRNSSSCGNSAGTFSDGTYTGEWTVKGSTKPGGVPVGIEVKSTSVAPSFFSLEETPATITGSDIGVKERINVPGMELYCESLTLSGTSSTLTPTTLTLLPTYKTCTVGGVAVGNEWIGSACNFALHPNGKMDLVGSLCAEGALTYGRPYCSVQIREQSNLPGLKYTNQGSGKLRTIALSGTVTGVKFDEAGSGCPNEGTFTNGVIKITATLSATNSGGGIQGISLE